MYKSYNSKGKTEPVIYIIRRHLKNLSKNNYKVEKKVKKKSMSDMCSNEGRVERKLTLLLQCQVRFSVKIR